MQSFPIQSGWGALYAIGFSLAWKPFGNALEILAQINFGEAPGLPDFPEKGILQFYILENLSKESEYTYGLSWNEPMAMTMVDHRFNEEFLPIYNRVFGTAAKRFYDLDDNLYDILYEETLGCIILTE